MSTFEELSGDEKSQQDAIATSLLGSLGSRLVRGTLWLLIGNVASRICTLISSVATARILGQTAFGEFGIITGTIALFGIVSESGMGATNSRYVSSLRNKDPDRVGGIIALSLGVVLLISGVVLAITYVATPLLTSTALNAPSLIPYLQLAALAIVSSSLEGALSGALNGFEDFHLLARVSIVQGVLSLPITISGVSYFGLIGAVGAFVANSVLRALLLATALRSRLRCNNVSLNWKKAWQERNVLWRFSLPAMASGLMVTPITWWCATLLARRVGGYADLGLFNAANQWRVVLLFIPNLLGNVALPILAETWSRGERERVQQFIGHLFRLIWTFFLPVVVVFTGLSRVIMGWYGPAFQDGYTIMTTLVLTAYVQLVLSLFGALIAASGKMWLGFLMNLGWALVLISFTYVFVNPFGAIGLATAYLLAYSVHAVWALAFGVRTCGCGLWGEVLAMVATLTLVTYITLSIASRGTTVAVVGSGLLAGVLVAGAWHSSPKTIKRGLTQVLGTFRESAIPRRFRI
ncbi:oligosaccharide flippase family protein [Neomoorella mulderi]|uniref:Colanic acid exporter n=1 Tax=Moorella mulderi DSM 14980 TaxID=1122241 RepID=A0A151AZ37_9FIRM|nr:oligosaccharide flippase family protein [Moorella mulderi]KYH32830.1 colanic acid exporter [Moorella mulderi DSM 14980]